MSAHAADSSKYRETKLRRIGTQRLTVIGMFSAIYTVSRYIPTFPYIGLPGASFRAGDFVAPALGILLGPWLAIPCIILGTIINYAFRSPVFLGLDFLPAVVAALIAGLIVRGKTKFAILFYAILLAVFLSLPLSTFWIRVPGGWSIPYAWLHITALLVLVSLLGLKGSNWVNSSDERRVVVGLAAIVFPATMAQHLMGGILQELIRFPLQNITTRDQATTFWTIVFYPYPVERLILTAVTTVFLAALFRALKPAGLQAFLSKLSS